MDPFVRRELRLTSDGSHTVYLPGLDEHYHSVHGALSESLHVFIKEGFDRLPGADIAVNNEEGIALLEVGFGTGLNALLTLERAQDIGIRVHYVAIEPFPLTEEEVLALNIPEKIAGGRLHSAFLRMHSAPFGCRTGIVPGFVLEKWKCRLDEASLPGNTFHLVYHDAFAPDLQPRLWDRKAFRGVFRSMRKGALLVTYSAKGTVKRALAACGFLLVHPPGPAGKREMTRAVKPL